MYAHIRIGVAALMLKPINFANRLNDWTAARLLDRVPGRYASNCRLFALLMYSLGLRPIEKRSNQDQLGRVEPSIDLAQM